MATTFTATPEPNNNPPRIFLQLEYTGQDEAVISRLDPDGRSRLVRLADPATLAAGIWVGYDYESWLNQPATYTATTEAGSLTAGPVTLTADQPWLRHPGVPSLSIIIEPIGPLEDRVRPVTRAVLEPIGRNYPIVVTDGRRKTITSRLALRTETPEAAEAIVAIMDDVTPLLIDISADYGLGFTHEYLSFGDLTETPFNDSYGPDQWRTYSAPYVIVDRPPGGIQSQRTYLNVLDEAATYAELLATYGTYTDLLTGAH